MHDVSVDRMCLVLDHLKVHIRTSDTSAIKFKHGKD